MSVSKRDILARIVHGTGLCHVLQFMVHRQVLLVVNHHRIGTPDGNPFDDGVFSTTPEEFEKQVHFLKKHFRILSLDDLLQFADNDFRFVEPCALITFDDGYRDNFDFALPILKRYGVTATFFLATSYIDQPRLPWWDRIAFIIKHTRKQLIVLDLEKPFRIDLTSNSRGDSIEQLLRYCKTVKQTDSEMFFRHLEDRAAVSVETDVFGRELFMSWDQLSQMTRAGMDIGSHTHSHMFLADLSEAEQQNELMTSKNILETRLQCPVTAISYPVGNLNVHFTESSKRLARKAGYRLGFSFYGGVNWSHKTDPFDIKRIGVEAHDSYSMFCTTIVLNAIFGRAL